MVRRTSQALAQCRQRGIVGNPAPCLFPSANVARRRAARIGQLSLSPPLGSPRVSDAMPEPTRVELDFGSAHEDLWANRHGSGPPSFPENHKVQRLPQGFRQRYQYSKARRSLARFDQCGDGIVYPGMVGEVAQTPAPHSTKFAQSPADRRKIKACGNRLWSPFDEVPYVAFRTPDIGKGKSRALGIVGALCYRPILCGGGSTAAAILRLLDSLQGTLVVDEFDHNRNSELASAVAQILNQGFQRGRPIVKCVGDDNKPRPFRCFGPKLFALRRGFADDATESRTLSIRMKGRTRRDTPLNLPRAESEREALALRNKLLAWRFTNFGKVKLNPRLADPTLEDRLNQIGLPLLSVAEGQSVRAIVLKALRDTQARITSDRLDTLAGEVWQVILELGLAKPGEVIRPGKVAERLNERRGYHPGSTHSKGPKLTEEKIAWVFKRDLELTPDGRDASGSRYRLTRERCLELQRCFGEAGETATTAKTVKVRRGGKQRRG